MDQPRSELPWLKKVGDVAALVGGLSVAGLAGLRIVARLWDDQKVDVELIYVALLGAVGIAWPSVQRFKFDKFEVERAKDEVKQAGAGEVAKIQEKGAAVREDIAFIEAPAAKPARALAAAPGASAVADLLAAAERQLPAPAHADDPQQGRFGGLAERDGRVLRASVRRIGKGWYEIRLWVESTDPARPLVGPVKFFLHDTFDPDWYLVDPKGGVARLRLEAYGAFTVGAICTDGTRLELDLADGDRVEQPDARFRDA